MLQDLGTIHTGSTPKTNDESLFGGDIPFVTPGDLGEITPIHTATRSLTEEGVKTGTLLPAGAVLVCCIGSLGKIGFAGRPLVTNQQINAVVFDGNKIDPRYGFFACRLLKPQLESMAPATTVPIVNKSRFSELKISVPPLEEQRRIAAILDQAETLRTQRRTALALLDSLTQSLFLDMFGDLQTNSRNFEFSELGTVVKVIGGFAFKSEDFSEIGFPVIRISNLVNGSVDLSDAVKISPEKLKKGAAFQINPTDILMAMSGATTGKIATVGHIANSPIYQNQRVGNFRITNISKINTAYLLGILQSQFYQSHIWNLAGGAAQPNISSGQLESALIPLPPLPLQQTFATRIAAIEALKATHRRALAALDALFASLQQRAFAGAL